MARLVHELMVLITYIAAMLFWTTTTTEVETRFNGWSLIVARPAAVYISPSRVGGLPLFPSDRVKRRSGIQAPFMMVNPSR
jgi:hypothetical protein